MLTVKKPYILPEEVTLHTVGTVLAAALLALESGQNIFDFSAVCVLDSTVLAFVLACRRAAERSQIAFQCINLSANLHALADLYGVTSFISTEVV
ncbi:MAG: STAS domain-containing protein [Betaproteobacteria bacterium]|nr:STAS domain-containing protein [Betaproteobacteria bacterium]